MLLRLRYPCRVSDMETPTKYRWRGTVMPRTPKPTERVVAVKTDNGGMVRVHRWDYPASLFGPALGFEGVAVCGRPLERNRSWLWCHFYTLNPTKVLMCKRGCWREGL